MQTINNRMTETQVADLFSLAVKLQVKAEESNDRDTAILAYSIQNACSNLTESRREFWAADATINNLELKITDMAVQLANAESKCRELAAENSGLKAGALYFSYGSEHNFEWHKTAEEAVDAAEAAIDDYRGDACDGWSEEVDSICWGIIMQSSTKVGERPRNDEDHCDPAINTICDYALLPNIETPATDAFLAEVRAKGVEMLIADRKSEWMDSYIDDAKEFAAQLRKGAAI